MTDFVLTIKLGNDAMQDPQDVAAALEEIAKQLRDEGFTRDGRRLIRDINGNRVGSWEAR